MKRETNKFSALSLRNNAQSLVPPGQLGADGRPVRVARRHNLFYSKIEIGPTSNVAPCKLRPAGKVLSWRG